MVKYALPYCDMVEGLLKPEAAKVESRLIVDFADFPLASAKDIGLRSNGGVKSERFDKDFGKIEAMSKRSKTDGLQPGPVSDD